MTTITDNRKTRRMSLSSAGKRAGLFGAAAVTAAAMTVGTSGLAPTAHALEVDADVTTTGPLLWLAGQLGLDSFTIPIEGIGDVVLDLNWTDSDSVNLYDAVNAAPFGSPLLALGQVRPSVVDALSGTALAPILLASGTGVTGAIEAYKALLASGAGHTPEGYTPLTPHSGTGPNVTNLAMILVRNLGTPNGGFNTRFGEIFNLFGIDPLSPEASSSSSTKLQFNSMFANIGIGYDSFSDFPVTANIFALANSLLQGALPTNLLGGITMKGASQATIEANLVGLLTGGTPATSYTSIVANEFALLEPLRLPARLINLALNALGIDIQVPTLLADALEPITKILVNIAYTDVVTPEMIANDPETYGDYQPYDRTFLDAGGDDGQAVAWLSQNPLTPSEWAAVPGDLVHALIDGFLGIFSGGSTAAPAPAAALVPKAAGAVEASAIEAAAEEAADSAAAADSAGDNSAPAASPISADDSASAQSAPTQAPAGVAGSKNKARTPGSAPKAAADDSDNAGSPSRGVGGSKRAAKAASSSDAA